MSGRGRRCLPLARCLHRGGCGRARAGQGRARETPRPAERPPSQGERTRACLSPPRCLDTHIHTPHTHTPLSPLLLPFWTLLLGCITHPPRDKQTTRAREREKRETASLLLPSQKTKTEPSLRPPSLLAFVPHGGRPPSPSAPGPPGAAGARVRAEGAARERRRHARGADADDAGRRCRRSRSPAAGRGAAPRRLLRRQDHAERARHA